MKTVFNTQSQNHLASNMFLSEGVQLGVTRFEQVKYQKLQTLRDLQDSYFWRPTEVDITLDKKDFENLSSHEQHIFTSNLKRQILLDSIQGRGPLQAFGSVATLPEVEHFINAWQYFESIHSESYTHIIRNVYNDPSVVFDEITQIQEIVDCANDISKYYNALIDANNYVAVNGYGSYSLYNHKRDLWLSLNAVNILEGIRFYVSFACSWAFAEQKKMEGNAKIIKFICRDENVHLGGTQFMISTLPKEDPDFEQIRLETLEECTNMFVAAAEQEKAWADYLFKDGSMIGLTSPLLKSYVEWITHKRMTSVGLKCPYTVQQANPLPWTEGWISGKERQVAPQETSLTSYLVGGIDKDVDVDDIFKGMSF